MHRHQRSRAHTPQELQAREALKGLRQLLRRHHPAPNETPEETLEILRQQRSMVQRLRSHLSRLPCREQKVLRAALACGPSEECLARRLDLSRDMVKTSLRRIYRHLIPCLPDIRAYLELCSQRENSVQTPYHYPGRLPRNARPGDVPRRMDLQGYRHVGDRAALTPEAIAAAMQRPPGPLREGQLWWVVNLIPHVRDKHPDWPTEAIVKKARQLSQEQARLLGSQVISEEKFYDHNVPIGGEAELYTPDREDD